MSIPDRSRFPYTTALRRAGALALASGVLATALASAQGLPARYIEECLESGTELVTLPALAAGPLSASECRGCETRRLQFDRSTRYFIGKEAVSYARFRESASQTPRGLYVCYHPATRNITRLRMTATGNGK
ncbi:MAG: hypothetical protein WD929_01795 [Steroidobacteraceae bacterium]